MSIVDDHTGEPRVVFNPGWLTCRAREARCWLNVEHIVPGKNKINL